MPPRHHESRVALLRVPQLATLRYRTLPVFTDMVWIPERYDNQFLARLEQARKSRPPLMDVLHLPPRVLGLTTLYPGLEWAGRARGADTECDVCHPWLADCVY